MISSMSSDSVVDLSFRPSLRTDLMCHQSERRKEARGAGPVQPYDLTTIFLHKIGSCFNQLHSPLTAPVSSSRQSQALQIHSTYSAVPVILDGNLGSEELTSGFRVKTKGSPAFREAAVRKIFQMIQNKFLARDLLEFLDSLANDIYVTNSVKVFPYKSFSETLTLVLVSLLRELVHAQPLLAGILINDIQGYIKQVFQSGSEKLSTKNQDITEKETDKSGLNVAKLSLLTNAVCVDILVWAAREETGQY